MTGAIVMPFEIGSTWYYHDQNPEQIRVPCPVCFGQKFITVVLGDGEHVKVECDSCSKGFDAPRGFVHEWRHNPEARPFTIASVDSFRMPDEWYLKSDDGSCMYFRSLYRTVEEAQAAGLKRKAEFEEESMRSRQHARKRGAEKGWSIRYHREQIAELERQIRWHKSKIEAKTT